MRMKGFFAGICVLVVLSATEAAAQKRLTIIHVNDTHSHFLFSPLRIEWM